jgi:hypothetical protein
VANADADERCRLREAILRHLRRHPWAADTAEGIVASWLPARGFARAPDHIDATLAQLVAERRLQARRLPDGGTLYLRFIDPSEE